ncbi:hypothetical protein NMY22_g3981 [Coprinellus aureogranulatus]|nr:hypothetical protein NMY22_g3981 [Coprinellus aureogranulatus]
MSSTAVDQAEVDRLARVFTKALFNLHSDATSSTTPARLAAVITEEPPSRALSLALVKASLGFAMVFEDLQRVLIRTLKAFLAYDRVKQHRIDDADHGSLPFVSLVERDFQEELKATYHSGALSFELTDDEGNLNTLHPTLSSAFFFAGAVTQGFSAAGDFHRVVALSTLELSDSADTLNVTETEHSAEAYAIATLIVFAIVGARKYAQLLTADGVAYERIREGLRALEDGGAIRHPSAVSLLNTVMNDLENEGTKRSEGEVRALIFVGTGAGPIGTASS